MELEIHPEPSSEERDAILRLVAEKTHDGAPPLAYRSVWREDGIRENALDPGPGEPAEPAV